MNIYVDKFSSREELASDELDYYRNNLVMKCKKCGGDGTLPQKLKKIDKSSIKDLNEVLCTCKKKYNIIKKLIIRGIQKEFFNVEKWKITNNNKHWKNYIRPYSKKLKLMKNKGIGFFLIGNNGTGKTTSMIYILTKAMKKKYDVQYILLRDLINIFRRLAINKNNEESVKLSELLDEYKRVDFLAIDEVEKINVTDFAKNEFDSFLRFRISKRLPMLMSTNIGEEDLLDCYGPSIIDLIHGNMKILNYKGESHRLKRKDTIQEIFNVIRPKNKRKK